MELTAELDVGTAKGLSGAKVNGLLMFVFFCEPKNSRNDTFTGLCDTILYRFIVIRTLSKLKIKVKLALACWIPPLL